MTMSVTRIDDDPEVPRLTAVRYDQTRQYHPFARPAEEEGVWIVQPPTASRPIGEVHQRISDDGQLEFICVRRLGMGESITFEGAHPTLFHAVSWMRWRVGSRDE
jgi:hypothetical protein